MEGRYICPVCDRRLKIKHFCTYCKSIVREPVLYNGPVANESYNASGRQSCMADQHYGLGHVHRFGDRQREYGHNRAGQKTANRPAAQAGRNIYSRQSARPVQNIRPAQNTRSGSGQSRPGSWGGAARSNYGARSGRPQTSLSGLNGRLSQEEKGKTNKSISIVLWILFSLIIIQVVSVLFRFQQAGVLEYLSFDIIFMSILSQGGSILIMAVVMLIIWRSFKRK